MTAKTPTASGISRLLAKAGFQRSVPQPGSFGSSSGFRVSEDRDAGTVRVRHNFWSMGGGDAKPWIARYAETVTAAGWTVEAGDELTVTAKER
jgi:hypothetical protein